MIHGEKSTRNSNVARNLAIAGCVLSSFGLVGCDETSSVLDLHRAPSAQVTDDQDADKAEEAIGLREGMALNHNETFLTIA